MEDNTQWGETQRMDKGRQEENETLRQELATTKSQLELAQSILDEIALGGTV